MNKFMVVSSLLFAFACSGEPSSDLESPKPAQKSSGAEVEAPSAKPVATPNTKPSAMPAATATSIPTLDLAMVDNDKVKVATAKNKAGLAKQKAGDHAAAIKLYKQALTADPGHILARYNLATALNLNGDVAEALAQLEQFKTAADSDCGVCAGRLVRATNDPDFASLKSNSNFMRITAAAKAVELSPKQASKLALAAVAKNEFPKTLVHPRNEIIVSVTNGNCDGDDCTTKQTLAGFDSVEQFFGESFPIEVGLGSCKESCCKTKLAPDAQIGDSSLTVRELCFATDSGMATTLVSMAVNEG